MKISNSKKQLAKIISENGGRCDAAQFYVSTCNGIVVGSKSKPKYTSKYGWVAPGGFIDDRIEMSSYLPNWHQTILSRAEYFHLYPAPDADGWIEWNGGECPVEGDAIIDIRFRDGHEERGVDADWDWEHSGGGDIIAYRLHKPDAVKPTDFGAIGDEDETNLAAKEELETMEYKPSIEQLAADYRNAKDYAERKRGEADAAKAYAEAKLAELVAAGKALGLVVSVADAVSVEPEPELVITDWRDLRVGDEVEASYRGGERFVGPVLKIDVGDNNQPIFVSDGVRSIWATEFRFIRRP